MSYALYLLLSATIRIIREFMIYDELHMDDAPSKQSIFFHQRQQQLIMMRSHASTTQTKPIIASLEQPETCYDMRSF